MRSPSWPHSARPFFQSSACCAANCVGRQALAARLVLVDPGREVRRPQLGEGQQQVGEVALGIDDDGRDAVDRRLFEQAMHSPSCRCRSCRRRPRASPGRGCRTAEGRPWLAAGGRVVGARGKTRPVSRSPASRTGIPQTRPSVARLLTAGFAVPGAPKRRLEVACPVPCTCAMLR